jgi:hypothetical protein
VKQHYAYPRALGMTSPMLQDLGLVIALAGVFALHPQGALALALSAAIPVVIAWSVLTLHLPTRVDIDDEGITFSAYGRDHRFHWRDIERIRVRRFVVRDRVLVRIAPSSPWRGRYWLIDSIGGYDALLRTLEQTSARG